MKKATLFLAMVLGFFPMLNAQWTSPGNGTTYTLDDLVEISGCVSFDPQIFYYFISGDITISANDKLYINRNDMGQDEEHYLPIGMGSGHLRFEDASDPSFLSYCWFGEMNGIQIINSDVTFDTCRFHYFYSQQQSSAVNCMNCDPVFTNCEFYSNEGAAIGSPANGQASPQILNCQFTNNVTSNANQPQINLGPGANDTIRIVNCTIEGGGHDMSGGITIADLMNTGDTKILLKDNVVKNNRYGYNQQGYNLSSVIVGNQFIDNNLETNPMNGGSGISVFGMNENNKAVIRNNVITGNLWGITAINAFDIDLNNWGTSNSHIIEEHIVHQNDDPSLGLVTFVPFVDVDGMNEVSAKAFEVWPNPAHGRFMVEGKGKMTIMNALGQILINQEIDGKESIALPQGLYFVRLGNVTRKVIVE